ncbi:hypothetical protein OIU84_007294 [Salix udensis]|uniref:APO domain-containing protein n=1 Tax=Salix udensis TaxID=889485 RepID=A0AAD6NZC0_9ROSI|nr:hypothetical protein OIU84_007294 [Salix udensis]
MKVLIKRAKEEREARKLQPCRMLENPPENGLLVPQLVPVAHQVYEAREALISGISKLVKVIPVQKCRFCHELHIGHVGHEIRTCTGPGSGMRSSTHVWRKGRVHDVVFFPKSYHLYDRVGKPRVVHDESRRVPRIPAITLSKRRKMMENERNTHDENLGPLTVPDLGTKSDEARNFIVDKETDQLEESHEGATDLRDISIGTMESWLALKGHKVRMCKATKHQYRDGLHAWQEATIDDLVFPNYVWHVRDSNGLPLDNNLKRYYGKAPAVVELCVQAGAPVPDLYRSMMRLDVVPPDRDEVDLVA